MFKKKEKYRTSSIIGREAEVKGDLKDDEGVRIDGKFEGKIQVGGDVIIGEDAIVKANIKANSVSIGGKVIGDVEVEGRVELLSSGSLEGKVKASDLTIAEGAFFDGECKMIPSGGNREKKKEEEKKVQKKKEKKVPPDKKSPSEFKFVDPEEN